MQRPGRRTYPRRLTVQAHILDVSLNDGACLVFVRDPMLKVGDIIGVRCEGQYQAGDVRYSRQIGDEYRVGVLWSPI